MRARIPRGKCRRPQDIKEALVARPETRLLTKEGLQQIREDGIGLHLLKRGIVKELDKGCHCRVLVC